MKMNEKMEEIQLEMEENFRNISKNDYDNVNTHYTIKYNLYQVDPTAASIEQCGEMGNNVKQINPILMLIHVFRCNIAKNGFEKRNELEFEIQNQNGVIIVFNNRFDCGALLPSTPSLMITADQCSTIFNLNEIGTRLLKYVWECVFNGNNYAKNINDCYEKGQLFPPKYG